MDSDGPDGLRTAKPLRLRRAPVVIGNRRAPRAPEDEGRRSRDGHPSPASREATAGEVGSRAQRARREGVVDTNGIVATGRDLMTEPPEYGRLSHLKRTARDGALGLNHPHRRSRFRSNVDSPVSLRSRERGGLCAITHAVLAHARTSRPNDTTAPDEPGRQWSRW